MLRRVASEQAGWKKAGNPDARHLKKRAENRIKCRVILAFCRIEDLPHSQCASRHSKPHSHYEQKHILHHRRRRRDRCRSESAWVVLVSRDSSDRATLAEIAHRAMIERGLEPDFPPEAERELSAIRRPAAFAAGARDMRDWLWASIDNNDSRDLDQLTVAEPLVDGRVRVLVAVADVDALVRKGSAIDGHAETNTTSVYTPAVIFTMLPEALSTDLTSLNEGQDRMAVVVDMVFGRDGDLQESEVYRAQVRNHAQLAYPSVGAWLEGKGVEPPRLREIPGLAENLRLQDSIAQRLMELRHRQGALNLEMIEPKAVFEGDTLSDLDLSLKNRATQLIEDFMIAANGVTAKFLESRNFPSLRRVLRSPERWDRIAELASGFGAQLPEEPDAVALEAFLLQRRKADPENFPDLSLAVVKLIGRGEYALDLPGGAAPGHFGLAVKDYTHSTAPNRRFPDLITQRLLKAALAGAPLPYTMAELSELAQHCTDQEDAATKVERRARKSAQALILSNRIGDSFDAIVTGASDKGTWVRIFQPPAEGRLERGFTGLDVGDHARVRLIRVDIERGYIDFARD
jgi:VacB/RNase II family 3'-5' exoribonuclease